MWHDNDEDADGRQTHQNQNERALIKRETKVVDGALSSLECGVMRNVNHPVRIPSFHGIPLYAGKIPLVLCLPFPALPPPPPPPNINPFARAPKRDEEGNPKNVTAKTQKAPMRQLNAS